MAVVSASGGSEDGRVVTTARTQPEALLSARANYLAFYASAEVTVCEYRRTRIDGGHAIQAHVGVSRWAVCLGARSA